MCKTHSHLADELLLVVQRHELLLEPLSVRTLSRARQKLHVLDRFVHTPNLVGVFIVVDRTRGKEGQK